MTLLAWIAYCRGDERLAKAEQNDRRMICDTTHKCNPWKCAYYTDGMGLACPEEYRVGPYFTPYPTEKEEFNSLIKQIGLPKYQQSSLF